MPRASWNRFLKLSLVSCPVYLSPATTEAKRIRLNPLNSATGNRLKQQLVRPVGCAMIRRGRAVREEPTVWVIDHCVLPVTKIRPAAIEFLPLQNDPRKANRPFGVCGLFLLTAVSYAEEVPPLSGFC